MIATASDLLIAVVLLGAVVTVLISEWAFRSWRHGDDDLDRPISKRSRDRLREES